MTVSSPHATALDLVRQADEMYKAADKRQKTLADDTAWHRTRLAEAEKAEKQNQLLWSLMLSFRHLYTQITSALASSKTAFHLPIEGGWVPKKDIEALPQYMKLLNDLADKLGISIELQEHRTPTGGPAHTDYAMNTHLHVKVNNILAA